MKNELSNSWLTEPHIELEYKSYLVLAYLNELNRQYNQGKLYPHLAKLAEKYRELVLLKKAADNQEEGFERELAGFDFRNLRLEFKKLHSESGLFDEILKIIDFTLPRFSKALEEGKALFDFIEEQIAFMPVGIQPIYKSEGYLLIRQAAEKNTKVYEYRISKIQTQSDKLQMIGTEYIQDYTLSFSGYSSIKTQLLHSRPKLPNPAVFAVESALEFPIDESTLPVAKRLLLKYIQQNE